MSGSGTAEPGAAGNKMRVLVVDDTDASRYVVGRMLRGAGYQVSEAATGEQGLKAVRGELPDLVVLDVNLPDVSGFEVCRQIKSEAATASIPVLHLSASYVRPQDQAFGLNQGADGYLMQPVEEPVLIATVGALLRARRAEAGMHASEARYRTLVEATASIVWTTDAKGELVDGASWCRFTGQTAEEAARGGWANALHPDDRAWMSEAWRACVAKGEPAEFTFRARRADGATRYIHTRTAPFRDAAGRITGWIGTCTDVTEPRLAEERVREARDAAEAANAAKDRFLAVLSHELRAPLAPVLLGVTLIEQHPELPDDLRDDVELVRRNVELETRLIDDLLDLSRVVTGKLRLQLRPTKVHEVIEHVLENCASEIEDKRLSVTTDLHAASDVVIGDAARLQQVLWNVVRNAVKFTPEGGRIQIQTSGGGGPGDDLRIEITDSGIGIAPEAVGKIFNAFEQGDPGRTRQFGGLGLGLAICRAVTEMHGGRIWAESGGHGHGSTFVIRLPSGAVKTPVVAPTEIDQPAAAMADGGGARLLVVEDHADTARLLAGLLRRSGYVVKTADSVASALKLANAEPFDLVVSDVGLPDATGYELMRQLRQRLPIKGIAMSGFGMEDDLARSREAGFVDHVVKPVSFADLEAVIRRVTQGE